MLNLFQHPLRFSIRRHAEKFLFGISPLAYSDLFFHFLFNPLFFACVCLFTSAFLCLKHPQSV